MVSIVVDLFDWSIALAVSVLCEASIDLNYLGQYMSEYHLQRGAMEWYKVLQNDPTSAGCQAEPSTSNITRTCGGCI